jgi:hypothetical protein
MVKKFKKMTQINTSTESGNQFKRMPWWFRLIFLVMLAWGIFFSYAVYTGNFPSEAILASMPEAGRELFLDIPTWAMFAACIGVISGVIGVSLVLLGRKLGAYTLIIPPIMFILRDAWFLIDGRVLGLISNLGLILSSLAVLIGIIQCVLAFYGIRKNWLK